MLNIDEGRNDGPNNGEEIMVLWKFMGDHLTPKILLDVKLLYS